MRILEARDGFIKFESEKKIAISSFLHIDTSSKQYIAQVIKMNHFDDKMLGYAKLLFVYDGILKSYDKTLPSHDAEIRPFAFDIMSKSFGAEKPIFAGKFIDEEVNIPLDKSCYDKKMLICADSAIFNNTIVSNLAQQFSRTSNILVIDMLGVIDAPKFVAGVDFKLPLNTDSLEFMFEDCLNDATSDSKSLIKEIFKDLSDYSKTVPFLPFGALKSIVDDMVDKSHVFKLLVLKNKLAKFDKLGYFASNAKEAENLEKILEAKSTVIDLSKLDNVFQNRYLSVIYSAIAKQANKIAVFIEASNAINKKNIKNVLTSTDVPAVFITHSRFKYINEIKTLFENYIVEPSFTSNEVFKSYSTFLNAIPKDTYLVVGKGTNYLPLIAQPVLVDIDATSDIEECIADEPVNLEEILVQEDDEKIDPSTVAIEKKSDELIEKVSEDIKETDVPELFSDEEVEDSDVELDEIAELPVENTVLEEIANDIVENKNSEVTEETLEGFDNENEQEDNDSVDDSEEISSSEHVGDTDTNETTDEETSLGEVPVEESDLTKEMEEFHTDTDDTEIIEIPKDISELAQDADEQEIIDEEPAPEVFDEEPQEITEEIGEIPDVLPVEETQELDEIVELDNSEISDEDILVDLGDTEEENETLDEEIVKGVDKIFTTIKDDSISDSDLDFIDELNSEDTDSTDTPLSDGMEELTELQSDENDDDSFLEPLEEVSDKNIDENKEILEKREASTPIVPVYNADIPQEDMVVSDAIEQGDTVIHAKYGTGVVEKMIKYGTKTLYSINFDNIGRRLLDPTLTEIKKA